MSYLQDRKRANNRIRNIGIGVVFLCVLIYFRTAVFNSLSHAGNTVFKPVINVGNNIGKNLESKKTFFASKKSLETENTNLKNELETAKTSLLERELIENENKALKEILGRKDANDNLILSAILAKPNRSAYDTLLIDAGEQYGVTAGDLVFAFGNVPIGKVGEVFSNSSKVVLFSTRGEKTDVVVNGSDAFMQIIGRGGGNFEMILPREFELAEGAQVTLTGITPHLLAQVATIISDPRDPYKKALLASPVNIQELKFVEVQK